MLNAKFNASLSSVAHADYSQFKFNQHITVVFCEGVNNTIHMIIINKPYYNYNFKYYWKYRYLQMRCLLSYELMIELPKRKLPRSVCSWCLWFSCAITQSNWPMQNRKIPRPTLLVYDFTVYGNCVGMIMIACSVTMAEFILVYSWCFASWNSYSTLLHVNSFSANAVSNPFYAFYYTLPSLVHALFLLHSHTHLHIIVICDIWNYYLRFRLGFRLVLVTEYYSRAGIQWLGQV